MKTLTWQDHFTRAAGLANMVNVAAAKVADPQTQAELRAVAKAVDGYIVKGVAKVEAELDDAFCDPVNPPIRR